MNDEILREVMFQPNVLVEIRSADDNNKKQIEDIRYFMENHFDIIIAAPNEADSITPIIKEVYNSGTPIIVFDRNIHGDTYTAYHGVDNRGIGTAAAHYARHLTGANGKVIEIYGRKGSTPAIERHEGFVEQLRKEEGMTLLATGYGEWNYEDAAIVADSLLTQYPETDLIYAHNDRMAIAASETAKKHGLSPYIIGIDAAPEIGIQAVAQGVIHATFLYPTEGDKLIRTALAILKGEPYDTLSILPASSAVDSSNADILLLQNEQLKKETDKIHLLKTEVDDYWSKHSAQTVLFYATIAIVVLLFGSLFLLLRVFWQRQRHEKELLEQNRLLEEQRDLQKTLNRQLQEATQSKLVFFTNVSHDLRTPLTLISEPVEQLSTAANITPQQRTLMQIAHKNLKILRRLIDEILDFRKYENGKLQLHLRETDFDEAASEWFDSFRGIARQRNIKLLMNLPEASSIHLAIDTEKMERVFFNLMSNAFKHTPDNGTITFSYHCDDDFLTFSIADTGKGIEQEDLAHIFDRFFQVERVRPEGSGIGLSLAKAFIDLHEGNISATSQPGKGSTFTVVIPVKHLAEAPENQEKATTEHETTTELAQFEKPLSERDEEKPLLLVIDDNKDIQQLIIELLKEEYNILTAPNGQEGVRLAVKYIPDLIICDVMMPVMDGMECCRIIKAEVSTSHIPVLMLTAYAMDEQRAQGYDSGADGYLPKPFSGAVLKSRCHNLIFNRKHIKELWQTTDYRTDVSKPLAHTAPAMQSGDIDDEFYLRFLEIFRAEMSNPEINVDKLASEMGLGRSQFYRKIKALTNYSPVELIRRLRLKQARTLLTTTEKNISEIAYEVGFSTPAYFSKCYREEFGETPTELRDRLTARS